MTANRRERDRKPFPYPAFLAGMWFGAFFIYLLIGAGNETVPTTSLTLETQLRTERLAAEAPVTSDNDGWHPIHVFYGDKIGLGADPKADYFAQVHQDEAVLELMGENGYFLDLAANDALEFSNTLALEKHGWNGLCIEPNPNYWYGLSHRKCTVVGALMGGETMEKVNVKFRGVYGGIVGKMDDKLANFKKEPKAKEEQRYTAPLVDVLKRFDTPKVIDYMSLDVEGAEYMIMQHFPFEEYQIKLLTIERPQQDLKDLLGKHGYIFLKELAWWGETLWAHSSTGLTPDHPKIVKLPSDQKK